MNINLKELALELIATYWANTPWMSMLKRVEWKENLGKKAGAFTYPSNIIYLNSSILDKPGMEQEVIDTLLHELIHVWQTNHVEIKIRLEPDHGKGFRGELHRINGILGREAVTLTHNYLLPSDAKILRKALALLARSQSSNEHEAALAAAKFTEFAQRYDLALSDQDLQIASQLPEIDDQVVAVSQKANGWRVTLLNNLAYVNACELYWRRKSGFVEWHMIGREHRLDQIVLLYDYLEEAIERVVKTERKAVTKGKGAAYWNSFRIGIVSRICRKLLDDFNQRRKNGLESEGFGQNITALMVQNWYTLETQRVKDYIEKKTYNFQRNTVKTYSDEAGYCDGHKAGDQISLSPQIQQECETKLLKTSE